MLRRMTRREEEQTGEDDDGRLGLGARLIVLLVGGAVALFFGGGAALFLLRPMAQTLHDAWQVRQWQPVPIEVLDTSLQTHHGKKRSEFHVVQARYRYEFGGRVFEGERIGLAQGGLGDNIGDWQRDWHQRLQAARDGVGPSLQARVNPRDPARALLDPQIRGAMLLVQLMVALPFSALALGALQACWRALGGQLRPVPDRRYRLVGSWPPALLCGGFALPIAAVYWLTPQPWPPRLLALLFALLALWLIHAAQRPAEQPQLEAEPRQPAAATAEPAHTDDALYQERPVPPAGPGRAPPLPPGVTVQDTPEARTLRFSRCGWRWLALLALAPLALLAWLLRNRTGAGLPLGLLAGMFALVGLILHGVSCHWSLQALKSGSLRLRHGSWLWRTRRELPPETVGQLFHRLLYSSSSPGRPDRHFHALYVHVAGGTQRLTPGLPGSAGALAVARALQDALIPSQPTRP